jgi:hypothetical protein
MTFDEMVTEVISITKRPDLQTKIEGNVRAATLKAHHSDFYYRDLFEVPVQFTDLFPLQSFLPTEVAPLFRKVKYIRLWVGDTSGDVGQFLTPVQIENSVDGYGYIKTNVYYMAGQLLQLRGACALDKVLFGCYQHPVIAPSTAYSSWIAVDMPYAIIYEAARVTFKSISFTEQANEYGALVNEQYAELKLSYVDDVPMT